MENMKSGELPSMEQPELQRFTQGLTFKQALVTLGVIAFLSLFGNLVLVVVEWRDMRDDVQSQVQQVFSLVRGPASEAAYQMHPELSRQVVAGLFDHYALEQAVLKDNFGQVLAEKVRVHEAPGGEFAQRFFSDVTEYSTPLYYGLAGQPPENVGQLQMQLSARAIASKFVDQVVFSSVMTLIRDIGIIVLVVLIFYFMITRPLLRLGRSIALVDPGNPGRWSKPDLKRHAKDELGLLVGALDRLLQGFQRGLDQRDVAQRELLQLTQQLEKRVEDRTQDLQKALTDLEAEKAETERAFKELDHAHGELEKTNQLVVESIRYARRIQSAMLPDKQALGGAVKDISIWWEPLHMVGGDYFWLERFGNKNLLVVADCTGHGVPGAFITLLVASALDSIVHEASLESPSEILRALDDAVRTRLRQDRPDAASNDGLDAAVCVWDTETKEITFAGAGLPLLYCQDGQAHEIRGDRSSLGYPNEKDIGEFTDHVIPVFPGMTFYMLTDGVPDHMGGTSKRLLGRRRLRSLLLENCHKPMADQIQMIRLALDEYRGHEPRRDDTTLIGFRPL